MIQYGFDIDFSKLDEMTDEEILISLGKHCAWLDCRDEDSCYVEEEVERCRNLTGMIRENLIDEFRRLADDNYWKYVMLDPETGDWAIPLYMSEKEEKK